MSFSYTELFVEIFACGIYEPCQISDWQLFLLSKTLCLHWCNKIIVGIVHFTGSRAPVQKDPSVFHPLFEQWKFYFLRVHKVLSVVLDQSIHSFVWMASGEEHRCLLQPQSALQTLIKNMLNLCALILPTLFLKLMLPETFFMTKLRVKMLKRTLSRISVYIFHFYNSFNFHDWFF